jgi:uncharacterized protein YacL
LSVASKVSVLAAILIADLLFFTFCSIYYPEMLQLILELLPWENALEKAIMIIIGLIIAVLSSAAIINILLKSFQKASK